MDGIYEISASEKVKALEEELKRELKELQNELEDVDLLGRSPPKAVSAVVIPKDAEHFRKERKIAVEHTLQVREAQPLKVQSDVMIEEVESCSQFEYTTKSLPLILHQFFVDRIQQLVQSKHMHMLRWARFTEHTKTIEALYPAYHHRLSHIMSEYHDSIERARRLAGARESVLAGNDFASHALTLEDLLIYTRWIICHFHSVKRVHAFLKALEWLPSSHRDEVRPEIPKEPIQSLEDEESTYIFHGMHNTQKHNRILNQVAIATHMNTLRPLNVADAHLPPPPPISLSPFQIAATASPSIAAAAAAAGGGLASDESSLSIPIHENSFEELKPMLEFLMGCYSIEMDINQVNTHADEMELFAMVSRRFKKVFFKQEQLRNFKTYDSNIDDLGDTKVRSEGIYYTFRQQCNWLPFVTMKPEHNAAQVKAMTKLRHDNNIDELLRSHGRFLHASDSQRIIDCLRDHAKAVLDPPVPKPVSVTTHKTPNDTKAVWRRIFSYTSPSLTREDVLEFDTKISGDELGRNSKKDGEFDLSSAVELLGLEDREAKSLQYAMQGSYLSYLLLRHLRLRDLQRTCLSIINYFRSVERTTTINASGLSLDAGHLKTTKYNVYHGAGIAGLGSHHYVHNSPVDFQIEQSEFMEFSEVENHDDFYTFEEGRVHVQDQRGLYIMYDAALKDFRELEHQLLLVASHFIQKDTERREPPNRNIKNKNTTEYNIASYGHQQIDRFAVLLDLWTNEASYLENKRQLLDCYLEAYHHVSEPTEKQKLGEVMTNVIHKRPRFDFTSKYFVQVYRLESVCLRLQCNLVKNILDKQIDEQREFIQKVCREGDAAFGLPHRIIPQQHIAVNTSRPALRYVYMLEFHPSLALASKIPVALQHVFQNFVNIHKPQTSTELISMERKLLETAQKEWDSLPPVGANFSQQMQKDLFAEVFAEDPLFVCEIGQSLVHGAESKGGAGKRKSVKERQEALLTTWTKLLEVITLRQRLIMAAIDTDVLTKIYRIRGNELGYDEYHTFLRTVAFEFAQAKPDSELLPVSITTLNEDDSRIDRYIPANLYLAIQELDEKHVSVFSFRNREGMMQLVSAAGVERLQTVLIAQVVHKNILSAAVLQMEGCQRIHAGLSKQGEDRRPSAMPSSSSLEPPSSWSGDNIAVSLASFSSRRMDEKDRKLQETFLSIQMEKAYLRDRMLNEYLNKKSQMGTILKNIEEVVKLKRKLIMDFCVSLNQKVGQHSMRAQIIAYYDSLLDLMSAFPTTRNAHFIIGEMNEKKTEEEETEIIDPTQFRSRPRFLLSPNGKRLLNLWFIPHFTEILKMFGVIRKEAERSAALHATLRIVSALHDICQYLCAHAKLGSSHARLGSHKLEFSGVTADWGGTEGIGAELREIQKQINHLENPQDPQEVADFLEKRRDILFLEFDISISHSVRGTFLTTANEAAFKSITDNMHFALQHLSNLPRSSVFSTYLPVPEPLRAEQPGVQKIFPWRSFINRNGPFPLMYWQWHQIGENLQLCLAGLKDVDRHVVNGEILGVSLLLEDVLQSGYPNTIFSVTDDSASSATGVASRSRPGTSMGNRPSSRMTERRDSQNSSSASMLVGDNSDAEFPNGPLSLSANPKESVKLMKLFLVVWSQLEVLRTDWGCRKLGLSIISTGRYFRAFNKAYRIDVLSAVYQQVATRLGKGKNFVNYALISDDEPITAPLGASELELKIKQAVRLLETLECTMIYDVQRKISREHTMVLSEKGRDDTTLPTDLWKRPVMKESCTIERPHLVESFVQNLMSDWSEQGTDITITRSHLNDCLVKLASETMVRERYSFDSYAMYFENLLRNQHQLLYMREQEQRQLKDQVENLSNAAIVEVHCQLADRSHELLLEITALRSKIAELNQELKTQENEIRQSLKRDFNALVLELFHNCFSVKNNFEEFRGTLYDEVHDSLSDVRRQAVEDMKRMREKNGTLTDEKEAHAKQMLAKTGQIRGCQEENKNLAALFLKMKTLNNWKRTRLHSHFDESVVSLRDEADDVKKECLEVKKLAEERETLLLQEQAALRKALSQVERECQTLRKKLNQEQKAKMQKTHAQLQEAYSLRQLEMAKSTNIDRLISDLEEKELMLRSLTENLDKDNRRNQFVQGQSKKDKKQLISALEHERILKLDAFDRVDLLQRQMYEYEQQVPEYMSRPISATTAAVSIPPQTAPGRLAVTQGSQRDISTASYRSSKHNKHPGGVWPPSVSFPQRLSQTPDPGSGGPSPPTKIQRPKTHSGRLRSKISQSLLAELDEHEVSSLR